jgi:hypothetical protein
LTLPQEYIWSIHIMSIIWKIYPAHFFKSRNAPIFNTSRLHVHHFLTWKRKCLPLIKHVTFWHHAFNSQHFSLVLGLTNLNAAHGFPQELICRRQTKHSTHNLTRSWERERLLGRIASPKKTTVNNMNIYIYIYISSMRLFFKKHWSPTRFWTFLWVGKLVGVTLLLLYCLENELFLFLVEENDIQSLN